MKKISTYTKRTLLLLCCLLLLGNKDIHAQWLYSMPVTITNNAPTLELNYQVAIYVNTSALVGAGQMQANGNDIRFGKDCAMTTTLPYYIDSGMNSTKTKIWIRIDSLYPSAVRTFYMFYGNATAVAASTINTFDGPYFAVNPVTPPNTNALVANSQRGMRFSPNYNMIVTRFGKKEPTGTTRYITLFDFTTQALINQIQVPGPAATYSYGNLASPVWLNQNQQYVLQIFQGASDGYYYGAPTTVHSAITFYDMRYCNSCTQNTFPTTTLTGQHYGVPDIEFYTTDTNIIAAPPTYVIGGAGGGSASITLGTNPIVCTGATSANLTYSATTGSPTQYSIVWSAGALGAGFTNVTNAALPASPIVITVPGAAAVNTYTGTLTVKNSCGSSIGYAISVQVGSSASVTTQPSNTNACVSANASFSLVTSGTGLTYQWQESTNGGGTWNNLVNGAPYSNVTTSTLNLTGVTAGMSNYMYRAVVLGGCNALTSNAATLNVGALPVITSQPASTTICPSANITFSTTATGTSLSYQWQLSTNGGGTWTNLANGAPYSNVTTNAMTITGATTGMTGFQYRCYVISGACGSGVNTSAAILTVSSAITLTTQPTNKTGCVNSTVTFDVVASSSGLTYQWQESTNGGGTWANLTNVAPYSNVTTASLNITTPPTTMTGYQYRCVLISSCGGPLNTSPAILSVDSPPALATQPPTTYSTCEFINTVLSFTATGAGLNYQWQVNNGSGFANIPSAAPYVGMFSNTLTIMATPSSLNGYIYRCVVSGACAPQAITNNTVLTVIAVPTITSQPTNTTICAGSNASFSTTATGTGITYQWQANTVGGYVNIVNGPVYSGATTGTLNITAAPANMNGTDYRCVVTGTCSPAAITNIVALTVNTPPTITSSPNDVVICAGANTSFVVNAVAQGVLNYQWQVNSGSGYTNLVNGAPYGGVFTSTLTITAAPIAMNGYTYRCIVNTVCAPTLTSGVARLNINGAPVFTSHPADITICPNTTGAFSVAATGTTLAFRWQVNPGTGYTNIVTDNATYNGSGTSTLNVTAAVGMNGYLYRCVVTGVCPPAVISNIAKLNVLNPITINSQTITDTVCQGASTKIGVKATGANLRYQWQRKLTNGTYIDILDLPPYSGVNNDTLVLTNIPDTVGGAIFRCRIYETVLCGQSFYTADIPLSMDYAPQTTPNKLTTGPNQTATYNVPTGGSSYQWQENSNDGKGFKDLTNGTPYSGVTTATLVISPVAQVMNGNTYRCVVDGLCVNPVISRASILFVDEALSVSKVLGDGTNMTVHPNPLAGTQLNISFSKMLPGETMVRIMDKLGKLVYTGKADFSKSMTTAIELNELPAGVYILQVENSKMNIAESVRFTKQ